MKQTKPVPPAAALINQIEADEAQYAEMRRQQEETKLGQFYLYDPYNPSDYDEDHAPPDR